MLKDHQDHQEEITVEEITGIEITDKLNLSVI